MSPVVSTHYTFDGCGATMFFGGQLIHHADGSHTFIGRDERRSCLCTLIGHRWDRPLSDARLGFVVVCTRGCCRGTSRGTRWPAFTPRPGATA